MSRWTTNNDARRIMTGCLVLKKQIFPSQNGTILIKYKWLNSTCLFLMEVHVWKTEDPRVNFEKRFAHYEIYTWILCLSYLHEKQTSRIQSLNGITILSVHDFNINTLLFSYIHFMFMTSSINTTNFDLMT